MVRLLIENGAGMQFPTREKGGLLSWAARNGHRMVVTLLIEHSADVNVTICCAETPLILAARSEHEAVAELLIEKGATSTSGMSVQ